MVMRGTMVHSRPWVSLSFVSHFVLQFQLDESVWPASMAIGMRESADAARRSSEANAYKIGGGAHGALLASHHERPGPPLRVRRHCRGVDATLRRRSVQPPLPRLRSRVHHDDPIRPGHATGPCLAALRLRQQEDPVRPRARPAIR